MIHPGDAFMQKHNFHNFAVWSGYKDHWKYVFTGEKQYEVYVEKKALREAKTDHAKRAILYAAVEEEMGANKTGEQGAVSEELGGDR